MSPNVAESVKARLLKGAKARVEEFERTLSRFAAERLVYRLGVSTARDRCVLKGAGLLSVWLPDPYRATRDVDLLASGPDDDDAIRALVDTICAVECPEDGLRFDLSELTVSLIRPDEEYSGKRARFVAYLGSATIRVQVDFGFGDVITLPPDEVEYPTMLTGLPVSRVRAYPRVASVAEKFEAMVKLGIRNSRMKDFHDIWALAGNLAFDGRELAEAVAACFERRASAWTEEVPSVLTTAFYERAEQQSWWSAYRKGGMMIEVPPSRFEEIGDSIRPFLVPVRDSIINSSPFDSGWKPGGPWT